MEIVLDEETPPNEPLSAKYKKSFAYQTVNERLPVIITGIIDNLVRDKDILTDKFKHKGNIDDLKEEIKAVIGDLSELKYQLQTSKPLSLFTSPDTDTDQWNKDIIKRDKALGELTYYSGTWLFVECYVYRRLHEILVSKKFFNEWDMFEQKKLKVLEMSLDVMGPLADHLSEEKILEADPIRTSDLIKEFINLLKHSLWANRMDLSLSSGENNFQNHLHKVDDWNDYILVDDTEDILNLLFSPEPDSSSDKIIDLVVDNAGMELLSDLCLADFLVSRCKVTTVRFRLKRIPWFVSDVMLKDFEKTLELTALSKPSCQYLAKRWQLYLNKGTWSLHTDNFWCLGLSYSEMEEVDPNLYNEFKESTLAIFKGDLNYRKLVQDSNWEPTMPFKEALGGFCPCPLVVLRTNKADTIAGLTEAIVKAVGALSEDWLTSGLYGLIQFCQP